LLKILIFRLIPILENAMYSDNKKNITAFIVSSLFCMVLLVFFFTIFLNLLFHNIDPKFGLRDEIFYFTQSIIILSFSFKILFNNLSAYKSVDVFKIFLKKDIQSELALGLKYFFLYLMFLFGIGILIWFFVLLDNYLGFPNFITSLTNSSEPDYPNYFILLTSHFSYRLLLYIFSFCILGPISEEIFFRKIIYSLLRTKLNIIKAILISSFIFSIGHFKNPVYAFIMGIYFAYIYEKHKSLIINISLHTLVNFMALLGKIFV